MKSPSPGDNKHNKEVVPNGNDLGLTRKTIHDARFIRDAEVAEPGIVRRTLEGTFADGQEPSKAGLKVFRLPSLGAPPSYPADLRRRRASSKLARIKDWEIRNASTRRAAPASEERHQVRHTTAARPGGGSRLP